MHAEPWNLFNFVLAGQRGISVHFGIDKPPRPKMNGCFDQVALFKQCRARKLLITPPGGHMWPFEEWVTYWPDDVCQTMSILYVYCTFLVHRVFRTISGQSSGNYPKLIVSWVCPTMGYGSSSYPTSCFQ